MLNSVAELFKRVNSFSYDRKSIPQDELDLTNKIRTSLFPWRGQFSPELVELFLKIYSHPNSVVLDPFAGSGTTLFEAARQNLACYGIEINPAAVEMAKTARFVNIEPCCRQKLIRVAEEIVDENLRPYEGELFFYGFGQEQADLQKNELERKFITNILQQSGNEELVISLLKNAIIKYIKQGSKRQIIGFRQALKKHIKIIKNLPYSKNKCEVLHSDARAIPLANSTVDVVITSPPYINVFNYHQNDRIAMELLGWDLLEIAKSEIGSNRKHRQNRFLTVIQYALDILDVLQEIRRVVCHDGRVIIVIGRESSVRGVRFENGKIVAALAIGGAGFELEVVQERKFKNKFGEIIYEDILHLVPTNYAELAQDNFAQLIATEVLAVAAKNAQGEVVEEVLDAKNRASFVQKSPVLKVRKRAMHSCIYLLRSNTKFLARMHRPYKINTFGIFFGESGKRGLGSVFRGRSLPEATF